MIKCEDRLVFKSDCEDDTCTFECQKPINHEGKHSESGSFDGHDYTIEWINY